MVAPLPSPSVLWVDSPAGAIAWRTPINPAMLPSMTDRSHPEWLINRAQPASVALETTLLAHGVPREEAPELALRIAQIVEDEGAHALVIGLLSGKAVAGMTDEELADLLSRDEVAKINTANLGVALARGSAGATTVSATMEIAARTGARLFATGGIGGVHRGYAEHLDVSSDLGALARFPVAVVASGVKSILDVTSTREALETLGVPVVGFETDAFPAFYRRDSSAPGVDARFDDIDELASFLAFELARTGRGVLVCNPIPESEEIRDTDMRGWLQAAEFRAHEQGAHGRRATPTILGALHEISQGATLRANVALVLNNARLAARLAVRIKGHAS